MKLSSKIRLLMGLLTGLALSPLLFAYPPEEGPKWIKNTGKARTNLELPIYTYDQNHGFKERAVENSLLEGEIEAERIRLNKENMTSTKIQSILAEGTREFTDAEVMLIGTDQEEKLPKGKLSRLKKARTEAQVVLNEMEKNLDLIDRHAVGQMQLHMDQANSLAKNLMRSENSVGYTEISETQQHYYEKLKKIFEELEKAKIDYEKGTKHYTRGLTGPKRRDAYQLFFKKFIELLQKMSGQNNDFKNSNYDAIPRKPGPRRNIFQLGVAILNRVRALVDLPASLIASIRELKANKGDGGLVKAANRLVRNATNFIGMNYTVKGMENLPQEAVDGLVNIIVPTHRHSYLDHSVLSYLNLKNTKIVAAVERLQDLPKGLREQLKNHPDFIVVEGNQKPVDVIIESINEGKLVNLVIYPEGVTPIAGETHRIPPRFSTHLVEELMAQGHKVNFIPVTHDSYPAFMGANPVNTILAPQSGHVVVHKPLGQRESRVVSSMGSESLGTYIRGTWMESLPNNKFLIAGQLRTQYFAAELDHRIQKALGEFLTRQCMLDQIQGLFKF